jgi:hypothetical protein
MFFMAEGDLAGRMLGCGDGPAGSNAEATRCGMTVVSCDPIDAFSKEHIEARIASTFDEVIHQTRQN